jgi:hypothetical protein
MKTMELLVQPYVRRTREGTGLAWSMYLHPPVFL